MYRKLSLVKHDKGHRTIWKMFWCTTVTLCALMVGLSPLGCGQSTRCLEAAEHLRQLALSERDEAVALIEKMDEPSRPELLRRLSNLYAELLDRQDRFVRSCQKRRHDIDLECVLTTKDFDALGDGRGGHLLNPESAEGHLDYR